MANAYKLAGIHITPSSNGSSASINVQVTDSLTGVIAGIDRAVGSLPPAAQARLESFVADALSFVNAQFPGANVTLPS